MLCRLPRTPFLILLAVSGTLVGSAAAGAGESVTVRLTPARVVGVRKICHVPSLEDGDELSSGHLVLMPDGRYSEIRQDCCCEPLLAGESRRPNLGTSNRYELRASSVILHDRRVDGTRYTRELVDLPSERVVLFDGLHDDPLERPVLSHDGRVDYGFAKVYPPEGE